MQTLRPGIVDGLAMGFQGFEGDAQPEAFHSLDRPELQPATFPRKLRSEIQSFGVQGLGISDSGFRFRLGSKFRTRRWARGPCGSRLRLPLHDVAAKAKRPCPKMKGFRTLSFKSQ